MLAVAGPYEDGVAALKAGDATTARARLSAAVEADPSRSEAWWELGWAHWVLEDWDAAHSAWSRVQALDPERDEVGMWLSAAAAKRTLAEPVAAAPVEQVPAPGRITFAAAGDTMMGSDLKKGPGGLAPGNGEALFADTAPVFRSVDVAFLNLEGPLADDLPDRKCRPDSTACYAFRTPTRYVAALVSAGLDVVSLANNHAMDLGGAGMRSSMETLDGAGIAHAGRYGDVAHFERAGLKIAVVAAHSGSCCLSVNDLAEVSQAVRQADEEADLVVFSFHGGAEGYKHRHVPGKTEIAWGERRGDVQALAHAAVDAGADLVLGHGPHVLRAMEVYRGRLVAYSLGNFMGYKQFGTRGGYGGHSVIVEAELASNGVLVSARLHPVALDGSGTPHPDGGGVALGHVRELAAADFPTSGVRVGDDGVLSWAPVDPPSEHGEGGVH